MPGKAFLDTDVLLYAFSVNDRRKLAAQDLLVKGGTISVQTLNEFVNIATQKYKTSLPDVIPWLAAIQKFCPVPVPVSVNVHRQGIRIAEIYRYHFYDSLMLAAALEASCAVFYSEDMQDGQEIGGMTIRNPFAA